MATAVKTMVISTGPIILRRVSKIGVDSSHFPSVEPKQIHAQAVKRILDRESSELVGWLCEWKNGSLVPRWKAEAYDDQKDPTGPKLLAAPFQEGFEHKSSGLELVLIDYRWNDGSTVRRWLVDPKTVDMSGIIFKPCSAN